MVLCVHVFTRGFMRMHACRISGIAEQVVALHTGTLLERGHWQLVGNLQ